ncbi:MAG TPA: PQQ-binding-like beta-propeller repeat protein [Micromonosporaceae bacterium]
MSLSLVAGCAVVALVAGCTPDAPPDPGPTPTPSGAPPASATLTPGPDDWPTYHRDNARSGVAPHLAPLGRLTTAWQARLDGAVYGQPLVVGDAVFAATEHDTIYALDRATGQVRWSLHVGSPMRGADLPCGNIDPLGITSTMAYDAASGQLFALAELTGGQHLLFGVDAATGAVRLRRPVEPPKGDPVAHQQRSALTVLSGRVYIAYGGLFGDCSRYVGSVVSVPTVGDGPATSWAVPTSREGGIWAPGGAAVLGDRLFYAVGNGESTGRYDGSDAVVALTPDLRFADRFTPREWADDNASDLDLGSMTPALVGGWLYTQGKRGTGYLVEADRLGGIGGQVATRQGCAAFGSAAVDGATVYLPCADAPRAISVDAAGRITERWRAPVPAAGSPAVGGGAVWVVDDEDGVLYALDPRSGAVRERITVGRTPHFASPTLVGDRAYVGTLTGVVAVAGA